MFWVIKNDRRFARPALPEEKKKREDVVLALRFFAIVLTDCLCWLPIIAVKLLAFTDIPLSRESRSQISFFPTDLRCKSLHHLIRVST